MCFDPPGAGAAGGIRFEQRRRQEQPCPQGHEPDGRDFLKRVVVVDGVDASGARSFGAVVADEDEAVTGPSDAEPFRLLPLHEPACRDVVDTDQDARRESAQVQQRVFVELGGGAGDADGVGGEVRDLVDLAASEVSSAG
ncbi:MAG: hypothetical protein ACJ74U_07295 [Jatrophihabitantaceae bacterium]